MSAGELKTQGSGWLFSFQILCLIRAEGTEGGKDSIDSFSDLRNGVLQVKGVD